MSDSKFNWQTVTTDSADGEMAVYVVAPKSGRSGAGVLLLHEAFGVNAHMRDVAERLAAQGYVVAVPDLFHRFGVEDVAYDDKDTALGLIAKMTTDNISADVTAAHAVLAAEVDPTRIGAVGFCFGGRCAFIAATALPGLAASACFYGAGITGPSPEAPLTRAGAIRAPLLLVYGTEDPLIPEEAREKIHATLRRHEVAFTECVHDAAGHAFFNDARPDTYHPESAADAWSATLAFLRNHLDGAPSTGRSTSRDGERLSVRGEVRALGWREGSSGIFTGTLEGLYQGFRFGSDGADRRGFDLELPHGSLAVEIRQHTNMSLPPRPTHHPFADGADPIPILASREAEAPSVPPEADPEAPEMTVELVVVGERSRGIFAEATGEARVVVPRYRVGGSLVIDTTEGELWMDFLEVGIRGVLQSELWVDGDRSTGRWHSASGHLTSSLQLHHPNYAIGTYDGTILRSTAPSG